MIDSKTWSQSPGRRSSFCEIGRWTPALGAYEPVSSGLSFWQPAAPAGDRTWRLDWALGLYFDR